MSIQLKDARRSASRVIVALLVVWASGFSLLKAQTSSISGVLKSSSGEPVVGALVKVKRQGAGVGYLVVSQAKGRYTTPNLVPGKYSVQAFGGGYQSSPGRAIDVPNDHPAQVDLVLNEPLSIPSAIQRLTDADF